MKTNLPPVGALALVMLSLACSPPRPVLDPLPEEVSAHTAGLVSRFDPVRIVFTNDPTASERQALAQALSFEPSLAGQTAWEDGRTLVFRPEGTLVPGSKHLARFRPGSGSKLHPFDFSFVTLVQRVGVRLDPLSSLKDPATLDLSGTLDTVDRASSPDVEAALQVTLDGKRQAVVWDHGTDGVTHRFTVTGLAKTDKALPVEVRWDGGPLGASGGGSTKVDLPAQGSFTFLSARVPDGTARRVDLVFSEPVNPTQDLRGLISVGGSTDVKTSVKGNLVTLYSAEPWVGPQDIVVQPGVLALTGRTIPTVAKATTAFGHPLPSVKFVGTGAILPTTMTQTVPIETLNVDALMVEALQVYDDNALQFFQVNNHDGRRELARVGRVVWRQVVALDFQPGDEDKAVRRGLDLSPLLKKNPKGFLVLKISIQRQHLRLGEHVGSVEFRDDPVNYDTLFAPEDPENSYWDYYEDQDGHDLYEQRENPLSPSYYLPRWQHPTLAWRNLMVSDIGLSAKQGEDGTLSLAVSDLRTAQPRAGVPLTVHDFQRQVLWTGTSDAQGLASAKLGTSGAEPAFVTATADGQSGYLKLEPGLQLSVSSFDTGGDRLEKGLNGFLYGERGVWRPGDKIFLTFILEDPAKTLPLNYPVVFELRNPQGQLVDKQVKSLGINGFYTFPTSTDQDAPTGQYTARVTVAGKVYEKDVKVETILPNRLKIDLAWKGADKGLGSGSWKGTLSSRWLHGALASNLKAEAKVSFTPVATSFDRWKDYVFDDPAKRYAPATETVFDGDLDAKGEAALAVNFPDQTSAPGRLQAAFLTKVFEPSGVFSSSSKVFDFHPYQEYVGLQLPKGDAARGMILTDTDHTAKLVLVDRLGNPVPSGRVKVSLLKVQWRWWWEKGDDKLPEYVSEAHYQTISSGTVDVKNGTGEWKFSLKYPDWGRFLVRAEDSQGHSTGKIVYIDWPGWAGRSQGEGAGASNLLTLTTDQTKYQVGDKVSVTFPSSPQGRAWVTIEAAGKVVRSEWAPASTGPTTVYQFPATADLAPTAYVHVTFLQPHQQTANDLPIRLYGVVPVPVEDPASRLTPVIVADPVFEPSSKAKVTVREANGKPMTYTLAVVDEGLLGITSYVTPDPWKTFFRRRASLVKSWDLYDWVSGAWTGSLQNILAVGGDGDFQDNSKVKTNRFPPLVRFLEPTVLAPGEVKTHWIDLPAYVGEVRIMAVAGYKRTYGSAERSVTVKSPAMALPTLPRTLSPNESFAMPVSVFAYDGQGEVQLSVTADGAVRVSGEGTRTVAMGKATEALATFPLVSLDKTGPARVTVTVTSGTFSSTQTVDLEVRMPAAPVTKVVTGPLLKPGETWTLPVTPFGYAGTSRAVVEVSQLKPLDLERRLAYLIQYPHGCIEQTTSSVFPQLYLDKVMTLSEDRKKQIQANVAAGIERLRSFQTPGGGFSYWPGQGEAHVWGTNYAGNFLVEAKKAGYAVPADLLSRWLAFEKTAAASWSDSGEDPLLDQAYRLAVMASAGSPDLGALNRLNQRSLPSVAALLLASAFQSAGQTASASALVARVSLDPPPVVGTDETFRSDVRDQALMLSSLVDLKDTGRAAVLYDKVASALVGDRWMSTQTTAWALAACSRLLEQQTVGKKAKVKWAWAGEATEAAFDRATFSTSRALASGPDLPLTVTNTGESSLTPRVSVTGIPKPGEEESGKAGLDLSVTLDSPDGPVAQLAAGSRVTATIVVRNQTKDDLNRLALSYLGPSGWELENPRLTLTGENPAAEYQDYRDDRVLTYFSLKRGESKTFVFPATAAYQGKFWRPGIQVEAMYDGSVFAREKGSWVQVLPPASR